MIGKFYIYNALTLTATTIDTGKNENCALCGEHPPMTELQGNREVAKR